MTSRKEAIEIAAKAMSIRHHPEHDAQFSYMWTRDAEPVIAALLAAGVIPAEGDVVIDRGRFERVSTVAVRAKTADRAERVASLTMDVAVRARLSIEAYGKRIEMGEACDDLLDGDLDAIPAALTGEGES